MKEDSPKKEIENYASIVESALLAAYQKHIKLEDGGAETGAVNIFGDTTYKADATAGKAVTDELRKSGLPLQIISEEVEKPIKTDSNPTHLVLMDELDGSTPYKRGLGRYATMVAIYEGLDPKYEDWQAAGVVDYINGKIYIASIGNGTYEIDIESGDRKRLHASGNTEFDPNFTQVRADGWFEENREAVQRLDVGEENSFVGTAENGGASCQYYMDLITGKADVVVECTRKRNLEIAVAYGLVKEAGGVVVDINGEPLDSLKYNDFGQDPDERIVFITTATSELAKAVVNKLSQKKS